MVIVMAIYHIRQSMVQFSIYMTCTCTCFFLCMSDSLSCALTISFPFLNLKVPPTHKTLLCEASKEEGYTRIS